MSNEILSHLLEELKKFDGFLSPEEVRNYLTSNLSSMSPAKITSPITSKDSPIVKGFSLIVTNKKCAKSCGPLITAVCDAALAGCFRSRALLEILKSIKQFPEVGDSNIALKLIPFYATLLPHHYKDISIVCILFSMSLSLIVHADKLVSTTAFASTQQMISLLFTYIYSNNQPLLSEEVKKIHKKISIEFENPLYGISYMLLYDLSAMLQKKPVLWLKVPPIPINTLYSLWEIIISTHQDFIKSSPKLIDIVEVSVTMPIADITGLSFFENFMEYYMELLPSTATAIFSYFLSSCSPKNSNYFPSLLFFRSLIFRQNDFIMKFYQLCDPDASLISALVESLNEFCDSYLTADTIPISLNAIKVESYFNSNPVTFAQTAPIEICFAIIMELSEASAPICSSAISEFEEEKHVRDDIEVIHVQRKSSMSSVRPQMSLLNNFQAFHSSRRYSTTEQVMTNELLNVINQNSRKILSIVWPNLILVLVKATRYSDHKSCDIVFSVFRKMIQILVSNGIQEGRGILLRILCGIVAKQRIGKENPSSIEMQANDLLHKNKKNLGFKTKRKKAYDLLTQLLYSNPLIFSKLYLRLFLTLSLYPEAKVNPNFTKTLSTPDVCKLCGSIVKGNDFCIESLTSILLVNEARFAHIFRSIQLPLMSHFESSETQGAAFLLIINVSNKCLKTENEEMFFALFANLLNTEIPHNYRILLLNHIKFLISNKSNSIIKGWKHILRSLSLPYSDKSQDSISISFSILNSICNDYFQRINPDNITNLISLIFEYVAQNVDINMALSSLTLLWIIVPFLNDNISMWKQIFSDSIVFFSDSRSDVAVCALRTFFSLFSSNYKSIPKEIYSHLVNNCFVPQLMAMNDFPEGSLAVQQLALQELGHCAISFWNEFENVPEFINNFWNLLIEKHLLFIMNCTDQEISEKTYQFYEECFGCNKLNSATHDYLTTSFNQAIRFFLKNEPSGSLVLSTMGRYIGKILITQKDYLTTKSLDLWLMTVEQICISLRSEQFVNLSAQKSIDAVMSLFPLSQEFTRQICLGFIRIVQHCDNPCVREEIFKNLTKVFNFYDEKIHFLVDIIPLFSIKEVASLTSILIDCNFKSDEIEIVFDSFLEMSKNEVALAESLDMKLIGMMPNVSKDKQILLIENNSKKISFLEQVWIKFCDPTTCDANEDVANNCAELVLSKLVANISLIRNDENALISLLKFFETSKAPEKQIGSCSECRTWHIQYVVPELLKLFNDERPQIKESANSLVLTAQLTLSSILGL